MIASPLSNPKKQRKSFCHHFMNFAQKILTMQKILTTYILK